MKRDAGVGTPVLPTTGGTAAGSVGAAVPLPWMVLAFLQPASAVCPAEARRPASFPEPMTADPTENFAVHGRAVFAGFDTSFKRRLMPATVVAAPSTDPQQSCKATNVP